MIARVFSRPTGLSKNQYFGWRYCMASQVNHSLIHRLHVAVPVVWRFSPGYWWPGRLGARVLLARWRRPHHVEIVGLIRSHGAPPPRGPVRPYPVQDVAAMGRPPFFVQVHGGDFCARDLLQHCLRSTDPVPWNNTRMRGWWDAWLRFPGKGAIRLPTKLPSSFSAYSASWLSAARTVPHLFGGSGSGNLATQSFQCSKVPPMLRFSSHTHVSSAGPYPSHRIRNCFSGTVSRPLRTLCHRC